MSHLTSNTPPDSSHQLTVYKASAGSGKTFTLTLEYIKLLMVNPYNYRHILAVTFTNKATEEMKSRILGTLYGLAYGLEDSKDYRDKIVADLNLDDKTIAGHAMTALTGIIHEYSLFRVETIDSFFQNILRNLARELDLSFNLRVEINDSIIVQQAVDELIMSLTPKSKEMNWIMAYIRDNISDEKSWNVLNKLKDFGEQVFKDFYKIKNKELNAQLAKQRFFEQYTSALRSIRHDAEEALKQLGTNFLTTLEHKGVTVDDFKNKTKGVCSYFIKLAKGQFSDSDVLTKRVQSGMNSDEEWLNAKDRNSPTPLSGIVNTVLIPMLLDAEKKRKMLCEMYFSAEITMKNLHQLRLLNSIEQKIREINAEASRFLLSNTQTILHSLIKETDTPFVFEKIGTQIKHIMIDEFQDTSIMQWKNFKVLLNDCMSNADSTNLIVGDVKQSIYRWRSGDWTILNNIQQEYKNAAIKTLDTNYRSARNIITFNNTFFEIAKQIEYNHIHEKTPNDEKEQFIKAYNDIKQRVPEHRNKEGYVQIELFDSKEENAILLERLKCDLEEIVNHGVPQNNIAIIVRGNKEINKIAHYFTEHCPKVNLISDEAFKLGYSAAVNIIIDAIRVILQPDDIMSKCQLAKAYQKYICSKTIEPNSEDTDSYLPERYINGIERLKQIPLLDLMEEIFRIFEIEKIQEQSTYINTLYDYVNDFIANTSPSTYDFLQEWDKTLFDKPIQSSTYKGVRLMTIHKSKGLEFEYVMLPFCDWELASLKKGFGKQNITWCTPNKSPFNELPIVPVELSDKYIIDSIYKNDYIFEKLQNQVDNLNLLYVAFTRASRGLFVYGKRGSESRRSYTIEETIVGFPDKLDDLEAVRTKDASANSIKLTYGTKEFKGQYTETKITSENVFKQDKEPIVIENKSFPLSAEFKQSNDSKTFLNTPDEVHTQDKYIHIGRVLHYILSTIKTKKDIDNAFEELENIGVIYDKEFKKESIKKLLNNRLNNKTASHWFTESWKVFNECAILHTDPVTGETIKHRPDRVITNGKETIVIDFKFGKPHDEYRKQVIQYMTLIQAMGYTHVKGYLWYIYSDNIEEVLLANHK